MRTRKLIEPPKAVAPPWLRWVPPILILLVVLAVFLPVCGYGFVDWDDNTNIFHNDDFKPPTVEKIARYWTLSLGHHDQTSPASAGMLANSHEYIPVTYTIWGLISFQAYDPAADEFNPLPYHALNLFLQCCAALLVYALLMDLGAARWAACAGAVLFAIHPLQVEPVAWVTGGKDVLSGTLGLAALWFYVRSVRYAGDRRVRATLYVAGFVAFLLAVLTKPTAVALPLEAAALALFVLKRGLRQTMLDLLPWAALTFAFALLAIHSQPAKLAANLVPPWLRPMIALDTLAYYLYKLILPIHFVIDYGRTPKAVISGPYLYFTWILPVGLAVIAWLVRRRAPWVAAGLLIFAAAPAPLLGLVPFDFQQLSTVADRYVYAGLLGPALIAAFALTTWPRRVPAIIAVTLLLALTIRAAAQVPYWTDSDALFTHTAEINPRSDSAILNMGLVRLQQGRIAEARACFLKVLELRPGDGKDMLNAASLTGAGGQTAAANAQYRKVVASDPNADATARYELGNSMLNANRPAESIPYYREALKTLPNHPEIHYSLGVALAQAGKSDEAIFELKQSLQFAPNSAVVHAQLADVLASRGDYAGAIQHFEEALRIDPHFEPARQRYAMLQQFLQQHPH